MNYAIFFFVFFVVIVLLTILSDKLLHFYVERKVKKLHKSFDCQAKSFDINNSMKGD